MRKINFNSLNFGLILCMIIGIILIILKNYFIGFVFLIAGLIKFIEYNKTNR